MVPIKFKRDLPINKNIFELEEAEPKNYQQKEEKAENEMTMLDPLQMSIMTTKFLLLEKIISYVSIFSIALSIYSVYYVSSEQLRKNLNIFHFTITLLLFACTFISTYYHIENNKSRRMTHQGFILRTAVKLIMIILAPNPWLGE